ncbi:MAG: sugar transferase, partial [Candidatus Paceibacteria bacterium]
AIIEQLEQSQGHGYQIVTATETFNKAELQEMVKHDKLDEVILCDPHSTDSQLQEIHQFCETYHLGFQYMPTVFETYPKIDMHTLAGVLLFRVKSTNLEGWGSVLKRVFDILFSLGFLIVFSPIYLIIAILIKLDSQGPVIYKNERVGRHEEEFLLWKFRTMKQELCTSEDNPQALEYEQQLIEQQSVKEGPITAIRKRVKGGHECGRATTAPTPRSSPIRRDAQKSIIDQTRNYRTLPN